MDPELLTGQTIHVYWPDDKVFYEGVVGTYKAKTRKHQVHRRLHYPPSDVALLASETSLYAPKLHQHLHCLYPTWGR